MREVRRVKEGRKVGMKEEKKEGRKEGHCKIMVKW